MNLRRHVNLWRQAARNLVAERNRTLGLFVPLLVVMGAAGGMTFVRDGFQRNAELSTALLPDVTVQMLVGGRAERVSPDVAPEIEKMAHVAKVVPRVWGYVPLRVEGEDRAYSLMGLDVERMPIPAEIDLSLERGRFLQNGDVGKGVIGKAFAQGLKVNVGDTLRLTDAFGNAYEFEVIGLFTTAVQIYTADLILTTIWDARDFFGYGEGESSDLCVYLDDPLQADAVAQKVIRTLHNTRALTRDALSEVMKQAYGGRGGVFQLMWLILLLTAMLLAWAQASSLSLEAKKQIGILKATGWDTLDVIEVKLLESTILGLIASLAGLLAGLLYLLLGAPGLKDYFLGWATVYPEFPLPVHVQPASVALLLGVGVFPLLVATVIPAWLAGITEPDEAIRG